MKCKICGSKSRKLLSCREGYRISQRKNTIFQCEKCGLGFLEAVPKSIHKYYFDQYYEKPGVLTKLTARLRMKRFVGRKTGRVLDIGCGNGSFLRMMRDAGWECHGTEISKKAFEHLEKISGINFYTAAAEKIPLKDGYFDLITFWHVLEHVKDPKKAVRTARRMLKSGGALFVAVPNIESKQARLGRCKWFHLDVPRHTYHFSPGSITHLLETNGFTVEKVRHFSFEYNPFGYLQTLYNVVGLDFNFLYKRMKKIRNDTDTPKYIFSLLGTIALLPLFSLASLFLSFAESFAGKGGTIEVYARKPRRYAG